MIEKLAREYLFIYLDMKGMQQSLSATGLTQKSSGCMQALTSVRKGMRRNVRRKKDKGLLESRRESHREKRVPQQDKAHI